MLLVCPDGINMAAVGDESDDDDDDDDDDGDIVELAPVPLLSLLLLGSLIRVTRFRPPTNSRSSLLPSFSSCSCGCGCDCGGRASFSVPRSTIAGGGDDVMVDVDEMVVDDDAVVIAAATAASEFVVVDNGTVNDGIVVTDDVTVLPSPILLLCPPVPLPSLDTLA